MKRRNINPFILGIAASTVILFSLSVNGGSCIISGDMDAASTNGTRCAASAGITLANFLASGKSAQVAFRTDKYHALYFVIR